MKKFKIILLFILIINIKAYCQSNELNWLNIGVIVPQENELLSSSQLEKLHTKMSSIFSSNGISSTVITNGIISYPKIVLNSESNANTGMANIKVVDLDLSLFIAQADEKATFASKTIRLRGSGKSKEQAINAALNTIGTNADQWASFINSAKEKINQYYEKMCSSIVDKADQLSKMGSKEAAMLNLINIPVGVSCYSKAKEKSIAIYKLYIDEKCSYFLQEGKAKLALKDYEAGLKLIAQIDPQSACFSEANTVMSKITNEVNDEIRKKWDFMKTVYSDAVSLERSRIQAIRDIGVAYGSREDNSQYINVIK
jgi:hypothetical protein